MPLILSNEKNDLIKQYIVLAQKYHKGFYGAEFTSSDLAQAIRSKFSLIQANGLNSISKHILFDS